MAKCTGRQMLAALNTSARLIQVTRYDGSVAKVASCLRQMMCHPPSLNEAAQHENQDQGLCKGVSYQQTVQHTCVVHEGLKSFKACNDSNNVGVCSVARQSLHPLSNAIAGLVPAWSAELHRTLSTELMLPLSNAACAAPQLPVHKDTDDTCSS